MKYITVKLTEDQARHIVEVLQAEMVSVEDLPEMQTEKTMIAYHAFIARSIGKINAELVKL